MPPDRRQLSPLRVAIVGIGSAAARAHLPALTRLEAGGVVAIVGVCDPDPARRAVVAASRRGVAGFAGNDEMLETTAPDLLVIATPPSAHLGEVTAAAARGVHVLCEKPLGLSDGDVAALSGLARAHRGLALATVHQYRHAMPWRWMARAAAGALRAGEAFTLEVRVDRAGTDPLSAGGWRADPQREGGILGDHAVHYLALLHTLDPGCHVVACQRSGPGGRETASLRVRLGTAGAATLDLSYASSRRRNLIRLRRPDQCLEMVWDDGVFTVAHDGTVSPGRQVPSLSDRAVVDGLYLPMYCDLAAGIGNHAWRLGATAHTVASARLLATAIKLAG